MSLIRMELNSECLTRKAPINIILPDRKEERRLPNGKYPVLWLLHGATDDHSMWQRFTALELYAQKRGIAVVMPSCENSFYTNTDGGRYFDYVTEELPRMLSSYLPISTEREDNFIAGMSMGGHGTMKLGFTKPEQYAAMGIFSCANFIDLMGAGNMMDGGKRVPLNFVRWLVFGTDDGDLTKVHNTQHDNRYLARLASESGKPLPKIFGCCGTGDGCHDAQKRDFAYFASLPNPYDVVFFDSPGFHYFEFWDEWMQVFIQWLPIRKRDKENL
jgi:putative tributyrin esterase